MREVKWVVQISHPCLICRILKNFDTSANHFRKTNWFWEKIRTQEGEGKQTLKRNHCKTNLQTLKRLKEKSKKGDGHYIGLINLSYVMSRSKIESIRGRRAIWYVWWSNVLQLPHANVDPQVSAVGTFQISNQNTWSICRWGRTWGAPLRSDLDLTPHPQEVLSVERVISDGDASCSSTMDLKDSNSNSNSKNTFKSLCYHPR